MKKIIFISIVLVILLNMASVTSLANDNENKITEDNMYKLMYENVKKSNKKIIQTVYWSLSSILLVIIAILGSNIYYNYRFNKKESEKLKHQINTHISKMKNEVYDLLGNNFNNYADNTRKELKTDVEKFSERYINQLEMLEKNLKERIEINSNFSKELLDEFNKVYDTFKDTFQKINDTSKKLEEKIDKNQQEVSIDINDIKAQLMKNKESNDLALMYYTLKLKDEINIDRNCERTLNDIISILKELDSLPQHNNYDLNEIIYSIPNKYEAQKNIILSLIKDFNKN